MQGYMRKEVTDGTDGKESPMSDETRVVGYIDSEHPQRKYYRCDYCGNPFWKPDAFRKRFCSCECQKAAYADEHPQKIKPTKKKIVKNCEWCNASFETYFKYQKYCSETCGYEGNKRLQREKWAENFTPKVFICKECNREFTTECGNPRSVFCCQSCANKYDRRIEHQTMRHKVGQKKQKLRREKQIASRSVGEVTYDAIYHRDGGICRICGLPVHKDKFVDNNWGGTIDHIEPLSVGGYHSMDNCQLAHRICNSLKCQAAEEYSIDWEEKARENNYWRSKFDNYKTLMGEA